MLELLGLPVRDLADLKRWGLDSMELFWGWPDGDRQLELARSAAGFYVWLRQLVRIRGGPGRNLFKSLAEHGLSRTEMCSLGYFLLIAGQETTTQLISTTLFRLLEGSAPVGWKEAATGSRRPGPWSGMCSSHRIIRPHLAPRGSPRHRPRRRPDPGRCRNPP